jgi:hypothetical protein
LLLPSLHDPHLVVRDRQQDQEHDGGDGGAVTSGPPRVITLMTSNTCSELINTVIDKKNVVGRSWGSSTWRKVAHRLAPSISAASNRSRRNPCNAAR